MVTTDAYEWLALALLVVEPALSLIIAAGKVIAPGFDPPAPLALVID